MLIAFLVIIPSVFGVKIEVCQEPEFAEVQACHEAISLTKTAEAIKEQYHRVFVKLGFPFPSEEEYYTLSPMEGALMDSFIGVPEGEEFLLKYIKQTNVRPLIVHEVFQRRLDYLRETVEGKIEQAMKEVTEKIIFQLKQIQAERSAVDQRILQVQTMIAERITAADLYYQRYSSIKKLMIRYRDTSADDVDQFFERFSTFKKMLERKMDALSIIRDFEKIHTLSRSVVEHLVALRASGMNHKSLWRLCKKCFDEIGEPPSVLCEDSMREIADLSVKQLHINRDLETMKQKLVRVQQIRDSMMLE
jgi:hypothetical protein